MEMQTTQTERVKVDLADLASCHLSSSTQASEVFSARQLSKLALDLVMCLERWDYPAFADTPAVPFPWMSIRIYIWSAPYCSNQDAF